MWRAREVFHWWGSDLDHEAPVVAGFGDARSALSVTVDSLLVNDLSSNTLYLFSRLLWRHLRIVASPGPTSTRTSSISPPLSESLRLAYIQAHRAHAFAKKHQA